MNFEPLGNSGKFQVPGRYLIAPCVGGYQSWRLAVPAVDLGHSKTLMDAQALCIADAAVSEVRQA